MGNLFLAIDVHMKRPCIISCMHAENETLLIAVTQPLFLLNTCWLQGPVHLQPLVVLPSAHMQEKSHCCASYATVCLHIYMSP